mgnify:CR=1 FL=1
MKVGSKCNVRTHTYLGSMSVARVEPLTTARALRGPFDYAIPERLAGIEVGDVLQIPFGPRRILGVVVEVASSSNGSSSGGMTAKLSSPVDTPHAAPIDAASVGLAHPP